MLAFIMFLFETQPKQLDRRRGVKALARCGCSPAIALPSTGVCKMGLFGCFFSFSPGRFNVEAHALGTCSSLGSLCLQSIAEMPCSKRLFSVRRIPLATLPPFSVVAMGNC